MFTLNDGHPIRLGNREALSIITQLVIYLKITNVARPRGQVSHGADMNLTSSLGRVRVLGLMEGWSFVILLFVAMPLKYIWGKPEAVSIVGMAHGVLFIGLCAAALQAQINEDGWPLKRTAIIVLGALLPFGPFVVEAKVLRPLA